MSCLQTGLHLRVIYSSPKSSLLGNLTTNPLLLTRVFLKNHSQATAQLRASAWWLLPQLVLQWPEVPTMAQASKHPLSPRSTCQEEGL